MSWPAGREAVVGSTRPVQLAGGHGPGGEAYLAPAGDGAAGGAGLPFGRESVDRGAESIVNEEMPAVADPAQQPGAGRRGEGGELAGAEADGGEALEGGRGGEEGGVEGGEAGDAGVDGQGGGAGQRPSFGELGADPDELGVAGRAQVGLAAADLLATLAQLDVERPGLGGHPAGDDEEEALHAPARHLDGQAGDRLLPAWGEDDQVAVDEPLGRDRDPERDRPPGDVEPAVPAGDVESRRPQGGRAERPGTGGGQGHPGQRREEQDAPQPVVVSTRSPFDASKYSRRDPPPDVARIRRFTWVGRRRGRDRSRILRSLSAGSSGRWRANLPARRMTEATTPRTGRKRTGTPGWAFSALRPEPISGVAPTCCFRRVDRFRVEPSHDRPSEFWHRPTRAPRTPKNQGTERDDANPQPLATPRALYRPRGYGCCSRPRLHLLRHVQGPLGRRCPGPGPQRDRMAHHQREPVEERQRHRATVH